MTEAKRESLNKFLAEWLGLCWHDWKKGERGGRYFLPWKCKKCGQEISYYLTGVFGEPPPFIPDYTTDAGFWTLWRAARESEKWHEFIDDEFSYLIPLDLIDPPVFAEAWAKFLGWGDKEK